ALALDEAAEPGLGHVEHTGEVPGLDEWRSDHAGALAAFGAGCTFSAPFWATSQHAACESPAGIASGRSTRQRSKANAQRGWNAQPCGMAPRRGMVPGICTSRSARGPSVGIAPIRPLV